MKEYNNRYIFVEGVPVPATPEEMYLDLLKKIITRAQIAKNCVFHSIDPGRRHLRFINGIIRMILSPMNLELVQLKQSAPEHYMESTHLAYNRIEDAETMIGIKQLDQMQACITDVIKKNVPGDLLEAGVWRGGMSIFMRGALKALGDNHRRLWLADSFEGLPNPVKDADSFGWEKGAMAVSLEEVKLNFERYGLLDERVEFIKGFFNETLGETNIDALSILRIDADLYESTLDVLNYLYPKLSAGGYVVIDDYQNLKDCQRAVDEYRVEHNITDPVNIIDKRAVYWIKS